MTRMPAAKSKGVLASASSDMQENAGDWAWNFGDWLTEEDHYSDTIISSRIRLARNLRGFRFPNRACEVELKSVLRKVRKACGESETLRPAAYVDIEALSKIDRRYFVERRLASPQLVEQPRSSLLVIGASERLSVMVNEEDHLRLQCIVAGLGIEEAWRRITAVDDELEENLNFCYSHEYGYLTACPTNLGTGLRVSVFVHLPALSLANETEAVFSKLAAGEIAVRGFYGEGTEPVGDIYQISNQLTLGRTEKRIVENIHATARELVKLERRARQRLIEEQPAKLEDAVFRALGTGRNARLISSFEAMSVFSTLRLGKTLGMLKGVSRSAINQLMVLVQPAHLQKMCGRNLSVEERDLARADFVRKELHGTQRNWNVDSLNVC